MRRTPFVIGIFVALIVMTSGSSFGKVTPGSGPITPSYCRVNALQPVAGDNAPQIVQRFIDRGYVELAANRDFYLHTEIEWPIDGGFITTCRDNIDSRSVTGKARLIVAYRGYPHNVTAIKAKRSGVLIKDIEIWGHPPIGMPGGFPAPTSDERTRRTGLVNIGSDNPNVTSYGQTVEDVDLYMPQGWSALNVKKPAEGTLISGVNIYVDRNLDNGETTDGISLGGTGGTVEGCYIENATDGGIVVFDRDNTVRYNQIYVTSGHQALGGINLVDCFNSHQSIIIEHNEILTFGSGIIHLGMGVGSRPWWCNGDCQASEPYDFSGTRIRWNHLNGNFYYGFVVAGAMNLETAWNSYHGTYNGGASMRCNNIPIPDGRGAYVAAEDVQLNTFGESVGGFWDASKTRDQLQWLIK